MIYNECALVCVDELTTALLRHIPRDEQADAFACIAANVLNTESFTDSSSGRKVGRVTREQMKQILRFATARVPFSQAHELEELLAPVGYVGEQKSPKSLLSVPIKAFRQCAFRELVRRCSKKSVGEALLQAYTAVDDRLRGTDDQGRARREFFKLLVLSMLEECGEVPESLSLRVLGTPTISASEMVRVEPEGTTEEDPEEETLLFEPALLEVPTYEDFKYIFKSYPHIDIRDFNGEQCLILGYASSMKPDSKTYRNNCHVEYPGKEGLSFKDLFSPHACNLKSQDDIHHRWIKIIPAVEGVSIRFWINIKGEKDQVDSSRFIIVENGKLVPYKTRYEWASNKQRVHKAVLAAKAEEPKTEDLNWGLN